MDQEDRLRSALADRYRIEREIGSGGMATVYLAQDLKHDRQVAVKVLHPDLAQTLVADRFLREQDRADEAREMLAEIYGWFTEGFDTADLMDAKALLEELGGLP